MFKYRTIIHKLTNFLQFHFFGNRNRLTQISIIRFTIYRQGLARSACLVSPVEHFSLKIVNKILEEHVYVSKNIQLYADSKYPMLV
jgi:hypothetical protein